ncbi:MAG TPA: hypothetical protein VF484_09690, partial [Candidatus Limnocylindrales bacterium]
LVTSPTPPIAVAEAQPGWVVVQAVGPSLDYGTNGYSLSDAVGGRIHVVLACTGTQPIVVSVDDSYPVGGGVHVQTFTAPCTPDGSETGQTFTVRTTGFIASYTAPAGIWSALTILAPH